MRAFFVIVFCHFVSFVLCDCGLPKICPDIVTKTRWGGRRAFEVDYVIIPVKYLVVHHTVTPECTTEENCVGILKSIQNFHMEDLGFHDIGYNFLIGGDGRVYEGAGWHKIGAHTRGYNSKSLGIAFIGDFSDKSPSEKQMKAFRDFIACGIELGEIHKDYKILGARQVSSTSSPGLRLYRELMKMEHFESRPQTT